MSEKPAINTFSPTPTTTAPSLTREDIYARSRKIAAARSSSQVDQIDYEQAKFELTGESDLDRQQAVLDRQ